jgi:hypothetical protein
MAKAEFCDRLTPSLKAGVRRIIVAMIHDYLIIKFSP